MKQSILSLCTDSLSTEIFNLYNSTGIYIYVKCFQSLLIIFPSFFVLWHPSFISLNILNDYILFSIWGPLWFSACSHTWALLLHIFHSCFVRLSWGLTWAHHLFHENLPLPWLDVRPTEVQDCLGAPGPHGKTGQWPWSMQGCFCVTWSRKMSSCWHFTGKWNHSRKYSQRRYRPLEAPALFGISTPIFLPCWGPKCHES